VKKVFGAFATAALVLAISVPATPKASSKSPTSFPAQGSFCCDPPPQCPWCDPLPFSAHK
jgi:hypothetical protein